MHIPACGQVEIKTTPETPSTDLLQKAADFVHAYILGAHRAAPAADGAQQLMWPE
jgi:hypothetical protein